MKKRLTLILILLACTRAVQSQSIEVKWTDQIVYDNKIDGFFDQYMGTNSSYVYAKFSKLGYNNSRKNDKVKIIAFDKNTMKKAGETKLIGYGEDRDKKDMEYYKTIILDNVIYVLWTKEVDKAIELYAQSFDSKLKKVNSLKKIYEINSSKKGTDNLIVIYNKDIGNKMLIAREFATTKDDESLRMEYKLINEDFSLANSNQVTLPIVVTKKARRDNSFENLICSYELGDDGNLYVQDKVKIAGDEKKKLKKGEASTYPVVMRIDLESGNIKTYSIKFPKKNTFNFSSLVTRNGIKFYGFFCDLDKDPDGNDTHGIFYLNMDEKSFTPKDSKFSYFDKKFLDQLYAADQENQKKGKGWFKSKAAKKSDNESLDDNYVIESVIEDGKDLILFCSIMYNWSETICTTSTNGRQSCTTYYYCTKNNVTAFKLNPTGDLVWASNLDRSYTYNRWNVYDLSVVKKDDKYFVVYGSAYQMNADKKNRRSSKSRQQMNDRMEYAVFQGKTGEFKKAEYNVNNFNTKKANAKYINASNIYLFDNKMYTSCSSIKMKPIAIIFCFCPPVSFSGNNRKGTGFLGTINTL